jgi:hypothetical protein
LFNAINNIQFLVTITAFSMKIIDSKGRLFGKISILDLGAILVILLVIIGIFIVPGPKGSIAQVGSANKDKIEVTLLVRGLSVKNSKPLIQEFNNKAKVNIIIRNQPAGQLEIQKAEELVNYVVVPQPDGTVKALPDPRPEVAFSLDMMLTAQSEGEMTNDGALIGNQKVKIGSIIELDGTNYNFRSSVIDVVKK